MLAVGDDELDVETTTTRRQRLPERWEALGKSRGWALRKKEHRLVPKAWGRVDIAGDRNSQEPPCCG